MEDQLRIKDAVIFEAKNPDNKILIGELMRKTQIEDMGVCAQVIGSAAGVAPAMPGYYGAIFAEVEVDTETGEVKILRMVAAHDVGKVLNPQALKGQMYGALAQGIGYVLYEEVQSQEGRIMNPNFRDYKILTAKDVVPIEADVES